MNKRAYSSTASEGAVTDASLLDSSLFESPKVPKQGKKSNKKKKTDKETAGQKSMTEFITTKENETKQNKTESPSIEKRLDEISAKLSNVLTRSDTDIIKNIIKESLEGLKEQLLGSVVKQIEILESNMFDQAKELASLKQQLSAKDQEINILKQSDHSKNQTYEAGINDLEQYGRRNSIRISALSFDSENQTSIQVAEHTAKMMSHHLNVRLEYKDIDIAHRLGKYIPNKNRAVIVKFVRRQTKIDVMKRAKQLKGTGIYIKKT
ncbi:hypothetical protein DPMN_046063 [Dreissena polymorpha]|uniref:Uncharacterized protein n=1 Tax=Dreissena polymorpha TaxID=45954 RepID=A0A9D4D592_DREPO|nr:hypothetical protein DPMN_046063 [Dreissena polymorpha]